jgi:hypothetical protein
MANNSQANYMLPLLMLMIFIPGVCFRQLLLDCWIRISEVSRSVGVLVLFFFNRNDNCDSCLSCIC